MSRKSSASSTSFANDDQDVGLNKSNMRHSFSLSSVSLRGSLRDTKFERRASLMGSELYLHEIPKTDEPEYCGFKIGDWVSTANGTDRDAPWKDMGNGKVIGPSKLRPESKMLDIEFDNGERFAIKAKNLSKAIASKTASASNLDLTMGTFVENDAVWFHDGCGRGIVVGPGPTPGMLFVRFDGIGMRAVPTNKCIKISKKTRKGEKVEVAKGVPENDLAYEDNQQHKLGAWVASVTDKNRKRSKLTSLNVVAKEIKDKTEWAQIAMAQDEEQAYQAMLARKERDAKVQIGARVCATRSPWKDLGVGVVRAIKDDDTGLIQFDVKGDMWALRWKDLEVVADDGNRKGIGRRKHFDRSLRASVCELGSVPNSP